MHAGRVWLVPVLVAGWAFAGTGCETTGAQHSGATSDISALRSQRRLAYLLGGQVAIAQTPGSRLAPDLGHQIRHGVRRDMRLLGLEVDGDPALGHDLTADLSASVQNVGRLARGRAWMWIMADGQLVDQIASAEVIEAPDRLADALSRDLVERLSVSPRVARYADTLFGRRLRPLRDTVGRHAAGRGDEMAGVPPLEMLNFGTVTRTYPPPTAWTTLPPPAAAPEAARAAMQAAMEKGQALLAAGQPREAYAAYEEAYLAGGNAEPLFGMAESLLRADAKPQAAIFYRAYLRRVPPNSPDAARATARVSALAPQ
jgi:hypothetical protein